MERPVCPYVVDRSGGYVQKKVSITGISIYDLLKISDYSESPGALKYRKKTCLRSYKPSDKAPDPNDYRKVGCEYLLKLRKIVGRTQIDGKPFLVFNSIQMILSIETLENELGHPEIDETKLPIKDYKKFKKPENFLENTDEFVYHMKRAKFTPLLFSCVYCDWDSTDLSKVKKHLFGLKVGKKDKSFLVIECKERMIKDGIQFPPDEVPIDHPPPRMFPWALIKCVNPEVLRARGKFPLSEPIKAQWNQLMFDERPKKHRPIN